MLLAPAPARKTPGPGRLYVSSWKNWRPHPPQETELVYHLHVPKAAGNTFIPILRDLWGDEKRVVAIAHKAYQSTSFIEKMTSHLRECNARHRTRCLTHLTVFLREPFSRLRSAFKHALRMKSKREIVAEWRVKQ